MAMTKRGGYRQPESPAPVSGPSALSQRTDGGPGNDRQPVRVATGGDYGTAQASAQQQSSAPMFAGDEGVSAPPASAPSTPPSEGPGLMGAFGPTQRPGESPLAGMNPRGNAIAEDVDGFLRVMYSVFPHPGIWALMRKDM